MISDRIPADAQVLVSLEPEELGLRMLPRISLYLRQMIMGSSQLSMTSFVASVTGFHPQSRADAGMYPADMRKPVCEAMEEAWFWLEGQALLIPNTAYQQPTAIRRLSRKALTLASQAEPEKSYRKRLLREADLNNAIAQDVVSLFNREKYDTAVFEAMRAVEIVVRSAGGFTAKDLGVPLMRRAFDPEKGPLADMSAEYSEREACAALFAGAIGSYKNPQSHRKVDLNDPDEAAEIILLANHLLRIVESRSSSLSPASASGQGG